MDTYHPCQQEQIVSQHTNTTSKHECTSGKETIYGSAAAFQPPVSFREIKRLQF